MNALDFTPQIAFVRGRIWSVIGFRVHISSINIDDMPAVDCPIVYLAGANQIELDKIFNRYLGPEGVTIPIDELLSKFSAIGCKIEISFKLDTQGVESKIKQLSLELT